MKANIDLVLFIFRSLGLNDYRVRVSLRDPASTKYVGRPENWDLGVFSRAWDKGIGDYFVNTVIVLIFSVPLTMLFGSMAAYVLARYRFWGNRFLYYFFVAGITSISSRPR